MEATLNLNNEVVKMRAQVKRVKVLVIRKLARHIASLKTKTRNADIMEKNLRRATRLHEEIKAIKVLKPDSITKAALQKEISFEKVCRNKESSLSERALARIATYPDFNRRIQDIKKAIEAFKAERIGASKAKKKSQKESTDILKQSKSEQDSDGEEVSEDEEEKNNKEHEEDDGPSQMVQYQKSTSTDITSGELVRMRKVVKELRVLIIKRLTLQIRHLSKTKGEESGIKENQESVSSLQKEIQILRSLLPDHVTTRALQGNVNLEEVLQDVKSSPLERATARIAAHPRFIKKLQDVRLAIEEEKTKAAQAEEKKNGGENPSKVTMAEEEEEQEDSDDEDEDETDEGESEESGTPDESDDDSVVEENKSKKKEQASNVIKGSNVLKLSENPKSAAPVTSPSKEKTPSLKSQAVTEEAVKPVNVRIISKTSVHSKEAPVKKAPPARQEIKPEVKKPEMKEGEEESDLESDGEEEKEYFDDSTEERFHKQSSLSEDSDEDNFFLGKVSKLKKKRSATPGIEKNSEPTKPDAKEASHTLEELKMQSVFCSTLSKSSQKGKQQGPKPPSFQNQKQPDGDAKPCWFKSQGPGNDWRSSAAGAKAPGPNQMGAAGAKMGKPASERQNTWSNKGAPGKPFRPPQQALHPSWEASRKRKEQQSKITVFQGKKIKFDDDD